MTLYPNGYGTQMITLERMRELHGSKMHPEFARRFFRYIESKGGLLGVGGGFRTTQPVRPGFAPPGRSFHEYQTFASGITAYCAVDLVVPVSGKVHRAPTWAECADAPQFLLHTFINNEPWHIQPIEIRGWQTWVNAGRPDPQPVEPPVVPPPVVAPPPVTQPIGEDMYPTCFYYDTKLKGLFALVGGRWVPWLFTAGEPYFEGDHAWTREQVLFDQGPAAADLWRQRGAAT